MTTDGPRATSLLEQGMALQRAGELWAAVDCYRRSAEADPDFALAYNALGGALANLGEQAAAMAAFQKAINKDAGYVDPLLHLGKMQRVTGQLQQAESLLRRAAALDEHSYHVWMELGAICTLGNRFQAAAESFEKALKEQPGDAHALHNLGRVAYEMGHEARAVVFYRKALDREPELAACHTNLGIALRAVGEFEAAQTAFERALLLAPRQAEAINGLVGLLELDGRYADALERLEQAIARGDDPLLQLAAARTERRLKRVDAAIARMRKLGSGRLSPDIAMQRAFILGDLYDESGQFDEAWSHYSAANKMKNVSFSPSVWARRVDEIIAAFPATDPAEVPTAKHTSARPVFIVGMPRSGTSLLEQILASHPQVFGAGELMALPLLVDEVPLRINGAAPYPHCMPELSPRRLTRLGKHYLDKLNDVAPTAARVTDKMWQNFEFLGLIERMLPGARVIHCRRDPLDTGLSCFFQNFAGQTGVPFSYDLTHIGAYYRDYKRLMSHWQAVSRLEIYEVDYEKLVSTPEEMSKALIAFIGLPWDAACLDFHKSSRAVNTASVAQVREPVYTRSVARYKHYEKYLEPLRSAIVCNEVSTEVCKGVSKGVSNEGSTGDSALGPTEGPEEAS